MGSSTIFGLDSATVTFAFDLIVLQKEISRKASFVKEALVKRKCFRYSLYFSSLQLEKWLLSPTVLIR